MAISSTSGSSHKENRSMKNLAILLALAFALAACNTVHGFGQDIQKVGNKIEDSAAKHR
jgi:entericidin A